MSHCGDAAADWSCGLSSSRKTSTFGGASIPRRTLSPDTRTIVRTMESPSRIRSDSLRDNTSMIGLRANELPRGYEFERLNRTLQQGRRQCWRWYELSFADALASGV